MSLSITELREIIHSGGFYNTNRQNVEDTEIDLMKNISKELWIKAHHMLIFHGIRVCKGRSPLCEICPISPYCFYLNKRG